jgi:hypothetical protein
MRMMGMDFDMVVVDYADILRDTGNAKEVRHALGNIYEDLRGLAGEFQIPVWTASQANRSALDEDVIEATKVAESYQKIMTADFVVSLSRKVEDKIGNTGRFHIIKNRLGPDGLTFPAKVNTNTGGVEIYESTSIGGKEQQHKIDVLSYISTPPVLVFTFAGNVKPSGPNLFLIIWNLPVLPILSSTFLLNDTTKSAVIIF